MADFDSSIYLSGIYLLSVSVSDSGQISFNLLTSSGRQQTRVTAMCLLWIKNMFSFNSNIELRNVRNEIRCSVWWIYSVTNHLTLLSQLPPVTEFDSLSGNRCSFSWKFQMLGAFLTTETSWPCECDGLRHLSVKALLSLLTDVWLSLLQN